MNSLQQLHAAGQSIAELIDAEWLEEDMLQSVLPCLDERVTGIVAVRRHQHQARLRLGLAQPAVDVVAGQGGCMGRASSGA